MLTPTDTVSVDRARFVADAVFHMGARYIREDEVAALADGFHILDKEVTSGD